MRDKQARAQALDDDLALLNLAFERLEAISERTGRFVRWLRTPLSAWIRIPLGILCIIASFFWFLPVLGVQFFPIGLVLIAQDVPCMRRPVAKFLLWLEERWQIARARFGRR